jgi:hypothetical protein
MRGALKVTHYFEETLKFVESKEMREYLRTRSDWFGTDWRGRAKCAEVVSRAPAPLENKIPVLELIAQQTVYDPEHDYHDPAKMAESARTALNERYDNPPGTVFLLRAWEYSKLARVHSHALFTCFDAAVQYIEEYEKTENKSERVESCSYSIEKNITGDNGKMEEYCQWILNTLGEIWYFDYADSKFESVGWEELYDYLGCLTLPVPFKPGDIILADCRPFAEAKPVLFIGYDGDEDDCCAVGCLFVLPDGRINFGAFSHNSFLTFGENSHIFGHYRAALYNRELFEREAPLAVIGAALKSCPELRKDIYAFIFQQDIENKDLGCRGVEWGQLKNELGI